MKSSKIIAMVVVLAVCAWIGSGLLGPDKNASLQPENAAKSGAAMVNSEKPLMDVRVLESVAVPYADKIVVTGRSHASRRVRLKAETEGLVQSLLKTEGDKPETGTLLARLELRDREARVTEARERVNQRQIEYNAARKLEDKGFNSRIRLSQALADLEEAKAVLKRAQIEHEKTKITAPFDGVIYEQHVEAGDYLSIGDPLFTIVDLDPIEFTGFISERHIQELTQGQKATAELLNGEKIEGTLSYIAPAADPQTRTFRIVLSAPNPDLAIKDGLTAKLHIPVKEKKAHKISPSILSLNDAGQIGIKLVTADNTVQFTPVKILADTPEAMWITGPPDTARIITVGQDFVSEGQKVNPVPTRGAGLL